MGELDLIFSESCTILFVEMRFRQPNSYGGALASVTPSKQQKVIKTALYYLKQSKRGFEHPIRFDVVSMEGKQGHNNCIKNAISC